MILATILFFVFGPIISLILLAIFSDFEDTPLFLRILGWIANIALSSVISLMIVVGIDCKSTDTYKEFKIRKIISLKNTNDVEGTFTLGSGSIETVEYYYYFYETPEGIKRGKTEVSKTYLRETNSKEGYLYGSYELTTSRLGITKPFYSSMPNKYILYVPKNTVIRQFKVD